MADEFYIQPVDAITRTTTTHDLLDERGKRWRFTRARGADTVAIGPPIMFRAEGQLPLGDLLMTLAEFLSPDERGALAYALVGATVPSDVPVQFLPPRSPSEPRET